jgi:hypothetical protein
MELYVLRVQYPDGRFEKREFQPGATGIGREAGDIVLGDPQVSSVHAEVIFADGRANFTDLGSTNGSMLAGQRLTGPWRSRSRSWCSWAARRSCSCRSSARGARR